MDLKNVVLLLLWTVPFAVGAEMPPASTGYAVPSPDPTLSLPQDVSLLEEGKALYENGQMIAALGKFMTVLRKDPHNPEARQYLRMIIDIMRQNPAISAKKIDNGEQAVSSTPAVQEEIRRMLQLRSRLTMDLKAIPMVKVNVKANVNQVWIETPVLFEDNSGGLKEQGVPILDRVAAWLKTYGQQPIIIHCYPEEFQEASANGSLFLRRYSELYNFFVEERKLPSQRFVSADLLTPAQGQKSHASASDLDAQTTSYSTAGAPNAEPRAQIVIETIGSQSAMLGDAMPSMTPGRTLSPWLENSITVDRKIFNPEEGEWASMDLAALSRTGLRSWTFTIVPSAGKSPRRRISFGGKRKSPSKAELDGHDQNGGDFVRAGSYVATLVSNNSDGTIMKQEEILQVERTTKDEPVLAEKPKPVKKVTKKSKTKKPVVKAPSPPAGEGQVASATADEGSPHPVAAAATPLPADRQALPADDSGDSVHAIWKQVIQFEPNQSALMPTIKSSLERIGKTLEVYPLQKVRITGFAMVSEANASALAHDRAQAVRAVLVEEYHVDARRVIVAGGKTVSDENASKVEMSITN